MRRPGEVLEVVDVFYAILFAHFVGDFVLQSDWMARNKSKSWAALSWHILVYTLCFVPFGVVYAVVNGLVHMAVDAVTSRMSSKLWQQGRVHDFFVVVGADQMIHVMTLLGTYELLK